MYDNLRAVKARFEEVTRLLSDPEVIRDQVSFRKLSKEHAELSPVVAAYERFAKLEQELASQQQILADPGEDPEIKALAQQELPLLRKQLDQSAQQLKELLLPKDPLDNSNIVLEIRAGTGGDEAALFAGDLLKMYLRYADARGWKTDILSTSASEAGGYKEVIVSIEGNTVYKRLKFESGVHRVQRVPQTEAQGRIHTSTATVAALPEADEIEVEIAPHDVRVDVFRSSGPGGQSVNTTDSAVRVTHLPTGIVVSCQDEKSQHKNKSKAMKILRARLYERMLEEQRQKEAAQRRSLVGTGDRSERIRTYNFPQSRVTDHRIGLTSYRLDSVLEGKLDEFVEALLTHDQTERLKQGQQAAS
jgi:peptide chain release factor 1